ncbi:MAG: methyltransferase domain-containing protein [Cyclobacteriaceae bacterium]
MPDFSKRSEEIEIMDDLTCSGPVVHQTLRELEFINKWLGGNAVTLGGVQQILSKKLLGHHTGITVGDVGCGGGDMLKLLHRLFKKRNLSATFIGIDANPAIIAYAQANTTLYPDITYKTLDVLSDEFAGQHYDVVLATLFFHHFTTDQLVKLFSRLTRQTTTAIVINDLHRHWLAYYSIKLLTKIFSRSSMVRVDAPLSVLRGFKKTELIEILHRAGIKNYSLRWKWAFRWQLVIEIA